MEITTGDDIEINVTLTKGNLTFSIPNDAVVKSALVDKNNSKLLTTPVAANSADTGSDWVNSLIVVKISGKSTSYIKTSQPAKLEIQMSEGGRKSTWFADVLLIKGLVQ